MIYSFKINSLNDLADSLSNIVNSSSFATIKERVPFLEGLFSSLSMKNLTNNPYSLLSSLGLNESTKSTLENFIANSSATTAAGSLPSNLTSLMGSGLDSINSETLCSIQILSSLCRGDVFSNHSIPSFLGNDSSFGGLSDLFNKSISSSELLGDRAASILGNGSSVDEGFNLSELKNLLGPFAMLSSSSDNATNPLFGDSGLASSLFSSSSSSSLANNQTDSMLLDRLFSGTGFGNQTGFENDSSFNPFAALFGTNSTGLFGQFENQSSSVDSNSSDNSTLDIIRMLEFFQSGQ
jgi:hypothetical protein